VTTGYRMPSNLATRLQTCYDSTVDELQLSYQGGGDPSIGNPLWVMTQLWMNYNWVTKAEVIHPLETHYELWLNCGWTTTELPRWKWSIHWKPIMSYDSTVDELQLSYQGGSDPSIENPLWVMTQLWMNYNWVTKVEVHHPLENCYELWLNCRWTTTELTRSKWSIHWKPVMSYDSTVDELQLSYQGGSAPSIRKPLWVMTQLWMNYNWVTKVEVHHPLENPCELWLNCGWTTTELPKFHFPPW
jgi:hypothetical protein